MIKLWPSIARSLDASAATQAFAAELKLQRVDGDVLYFAHQEPATLSATRKLADALSQHTGQALTVVIHHAASNTRQRCYSHITKGKRA